MMDQDTLRERLAKLHSELKEAHQQLPPERQSLGGILTDLQAESLDKSLPERLEQAAVQFEAEHPTLAASARRLIDLLSEVGI
jgi:Domain of unknown function (DUF4404)